MPITEDDNDALTPGDDSAPGKFLMIEVPNFRDGVSRDGRMPPRPGLQNRQPRSYLRLGMPHEHAGEADSIDYGEDLATLVQGFTDDTRVRDDADAALSAAQAAEVPSGNDSGAATDTTADGQARAPGHGLTIAQRKRLSEELHKYGGWRDHSDGNRISTTNGDKVEVVRGNYKLIVLGRQNAELEVEPPPRDPNEPGISDEERRHRQEQADHRAEELEHRNHALESGNAWEASGGQIDEPKDGIFGQIPAGATQRQREEALAQAALEIRYEWIRTGDPDQHRWKKIVEEGKQGANNPVMVEHLFARRIIEHKGSELDPILEIDESTHATKLTEHFKGESLSDTKDFDFINEDKTAKKHLNEIKKVGGALTEFKFAGGTFVEIIMAGTMHEAKVALLNADVKAFGAQFEAKAAGIVFELAVANEFKMHVGAAFEAHHGTHYRFVAAHAETHGATVRQHGASVTTGGSEVAVNGTRVSTGGPQFVG